MTANRRLAILKSVLWAIVGVAAVVTVARFRHGLGATTNLSDATPWGLWIGFDVMAGVALAAGGFVLAATVYIFGLERYRPFVRPAILTAFLGYVAVAVGLLYDLGLPWNIWHPMIHWQHHSVLFEVAMCVMLYLTVLALEFAPAVLERPALDRRLLRQILDGLRRATIPLVIAGITLSTLHQSSLGSLFLIAPHRLHPLWYSPIIYVLFFISAVALGLMMVTLESLLAAYFLGHRPKVSLLSGLGLGASIVLAVYAALRLGDLAVRGVLSSSLDGSGLGVLFVIELAVSAVIPAGLLLVRRVRTSVPGLALCASMTVLGMILYRLDVCIVAFARPEDMPYFPSWMELAISFGIVSAAVLAFIFIVERVRIYDEPPGQRDAIRPRPLAEPAAARLLLPAVIGAPRRYSLLLIGAAAVTVALLPPQAVFGLRPRLSPTHDPRMIEGVVLESESGPGRSLHLEQPAGPHAAIGEPVSLLLIDGNRNGDSVLFDHDAHKERLGGDDSCGQCHHMNLPLDRATPCYECHRDMNEPTLTFDHAAHIRSTKGNQGCTDCHDPDAPVKDLESATACADCHTDMRAPDAFLDRPPDRWNAAVGYRSAMHGLCIQCHETKAADASIEFPDRLTECAGCHDSDRAQSIQRLIPRIDAPARL